MKSLDIDKYVNKPTNEKLNLITVYVDDNLLINEDGQGRSINRPACIATAKPFGCC